MARGGLLTQLFTELFETLPAEGAHLVLRSSCTQSYWAGGTASDGYWTANPEAATVFSVSSEAFCLCVRHKLTGVELVLRTPETHVEILSTVLC